MLLTREIKYLFEKCGNQEELSDPIVVTRYAPPDNSVNYFPIEYSEDNGVFWGYVKSKNNSGYNYFSLEELKELRISDLELRMKRDLDFMPTPLSMNIPEIAKQLGKACDMDFNKTNSPIYLIHNEHNEIFDYWLGFDSSKRHFILKGFQKVEWGIRFLEKKYEYFEGLRKVRYDIKKYGEFSPRPYRLGQPFDSTVEIPVLALYHNYCRKMQINADKVFKSAYPDLNMDGKTIREHAMWQGIEFPKKWMDVDYDCLMNSLRDINYPHLVTALSETEQRFKIEGLKYSIRQLEQKNQQKIKPKL